jgi:hypothetical protein
MEALFEYDVYVPTVSDAGVAYPKSLLEGYKHVLVEHFGGVTDFRHRSEGVWRLGSTTFRDEIVLYRVLTAERASAHTLLQTLQQRMCRELKQREVLVIERQVARL